MLVEFQNCTKLRLEFFTFWTIKSTFLCQNLTLNAPDYLSGAIRSCIFSCNGALVFSLSFSSILHLL